MKLPDIQDFTCTPDPKDDLDGYHAWKQFGGLTLTQARTKFFENPGFYQEDFMFMGTRAFLFYFPVLDTYMREVEGPKEQFDDNGWIIGCGIEIQFELGGQTLEPIRDVATCLCNYVLEALSRLPPGATWQPVAEIEHAWIQAKASVLEPKEDAPTSAPRR